MEKKAVVLFSGGIDSTTALYWAKKNFREVIALIIDYEQRHRLEVAMAEKIASRLSCSHQTFRLPLRNFLSSALLDEKQAIPDSLSQLEKEGGIPPTYVPFRNGIFISLAAAFAESKNIQSLVTGFNCIDSPDYPDTSEGFTKKMEDAVNAGTLAVFSGRRFRIHTPLIHKSKSEIISMGKGLQADYSFSISCYRGNEIPCRSCTSCEIRSKAFAKLNMTDPLIVRLLKEKKL